MGVASVAVLGFSWERLQSRCFCSSVPKSIVAEATPTTTIGDAPLSWERLQSQCSAFRGSDFSRDASAPACRTASWLKPLPQPQLAMLGFSWERLQSRCFCSSVPKSIVAEATPAHRQLAMLGFSWERLQSRCSAFRGSDFSRDASAPACRTASWLKPLPQRQLAMLGFSWERLQSRCFCSSVPNSIVAEATPTTAIGGARLFVGATSVAVLGCSWERLQSRSFCSSVPNSIVAEATPATAVRGAAERCLPVGSKTSGFPT